MPDDDVPVVIIGGSLVGLSTAVFLGAQGIPSLVIERHPGTAIHPRAALVSQRTIELFRAHGMQAEIEEAAAAEFVQNGAIMSVESLGGRELTWYFRTINEGVEDLSPSPRLFVTQIGLEPILRRHAEAGGVRLEYSSEAVGLEQDGDGVDVRVRAGDGSERTVRARYVVAADGVKSPTRERLGIAYRGRGSFSDSITIYFRADVNALIGDRNLSVIYVFHPRLTGFFRFSLAGDAGFLVVNSTVDEHGVRSTSPGEDTSEERCIEYVRRALGDPDIHGRDRERPALELDGELGRAAAGGARVPRRGRGPRDAADGRLRRQHGRARCRQPGVEAGARWCAARPGPDCSPATTRSADPVAELTVEQAYTRYVMRLDPGTRQGGSMPIVEEATVELGYRYHSSAVVADAGEDGSLWATRTAPRRGRARVRRTSRSRWQRETRLDDRLRASRIRPARWARTARTWCAAAQAARRGWAYPSRAHARRHTGLRRALRHRGRGAVLLRPDGFVAWRSRSASADAPGELLGVLRGILDLG